MQSLRHLPGVWFAPAAVLALASLAACTRQPQTAALVKSPGLQYDVHERLQTERGTYVTHVYRYYFLGPFVRRDTLAVSGEQPDRVTTSIVDCRTRDETLIERSGRVTHTKLAPPAAFTSTRQPDNVAGMIVERTRTIGHKRIDGTAADGFETTARASYRTGGVRRTYTATLIAWYADTVRRPAYGFLCSRRSSASDSARLLGGVKTVHTGARVPNDRLRLSYEQRSTTPGASMTQEIFNLKPLGEGDLSLFRLRK